MDVAFEAKSDTTNGVYQIINHSPVFNVIHTDQYDIQDRLKKGRITALIDIRKETGNNAAVPQYDVHLKTTSASQKDLPVLQTVLRDVISTINTRQNPSSDSYATISKEEVPGRIYRSIDFYLPGMLGFSLIGSAIFGVSFLFFSLRETLVLKRMFASPVKRQSRCEAVIVPANYQAVIWIGGRHPAARAIVGAAPAIASDRRNTPVSI